MLCHKCYNVLTRVVQSGELEYLCLGCKATYKTTNKDSLIYASKIETFQYPKNGKLIFNYPCNKKILSPCPNCKAKLVAVDETGKDKIYGCGCGFSWKLVSNEKSS